MQLSVVSAQFRWFRPCGFNFRGNAPFTIDVAEAEPPGRPMTTNRVEAKSQLRARELVIPGSCLAHGRLRRGHLSRLCRYASLHAIRSSWRNFYDVESF